MPSARLQWEEGLRFVGRSGSGHSVVLDSRPAAEGPAAGPSPIELTLMGLAGCTGMDVVSILEKKRQRVERFEIEVRGEKSAEPPFHLPRIELVFRVWGDVSEDALVQSIELSQEKYCSVSNTMKSTAEIVYSFEINP